MEKCQWMQNLRKSTMTTRNNESGGWIIPATLKRGKYDYQRGLYNEQ